MTLNDVLKKLKSQANPANVAGMARFGITPKSKILGVPMPTLRALGKQIGKNSAFKKAPADAKALADKHQLAQRLWDSGIHEAKILAGLVEDVKLVSGAQMDKWARGFDSWDVCDQTCLNLFYAHPLAFKKCAAWAGNKKEFVRRAGFALMACLAFKDKRAGDNDFIKFFPLIKKYAADERNYVKKAVNWALRQIGKRNLALNKKAVAVAREIAKQPSKSAKWIAADALRELTSLKIIKMIKKRSLNK